MARPAPRNPELLAALVATLRATAEGTPTAEGVGPVADRVRNEIDPAIAARLVANFDRINPSIRRSALGEWFDRPVDMTPKSSGQPTDAGTGGDRAIGAAGGRLGGAGRFGPGDAGATTTSDGADPGTPAPPVYTVTFRGMYCNSETRWDGLSNSDEPYFQTFATWWDEDAVNHTESLQHPVDKGNYEDVDDGEPRVGPVAAVWQGSRLPMSLTVVAFEHDFGDPDYYKKEIATIVAAAAALVSYLYAPGPLGAALSAALVPLIVDALNWLIDTDDDRIGDPFIKVLDVPEMEKYGRRLPSPYPSKAGQSISALEGHFFSTHVSDGADYAAAFQVERDPALPRDSGPLL